MISFSIYCELALWGSYLKVSDQTMKFCSLYMIQHFIKWKNFSIVDNAFWNSFAHVCTETFNSLCHNLYFALGGSKSWNISMSYVFVHADWGSLLLFWQHQIQFNLQTACILDSFSYAFIFYRFWIWKSLSIILSWNFLSCSIKKKVGFFS